jgi:hypothetical protein
VDEAPILGRGDDGRLYQQFLAQYDAPAYVRRARQVQEAFDLLLNRCQRQRDEWLYMSRLRFGTLRELAGDWAQLRPWLADEDQVSILEHLQALLDPQLRLPVARTLSPRVLRHALYELKDSLEHFNRRWQRFLSTVDLTEVNALREDYNRYFLLEKECALRSPRLARQGFSRLEPLTPGELAALLPLLQVPQLK